MNDKIMIFMNLFTYVKKFFGIPAAVCLLAPATAMGAKENTARPAQPNVILLLDGRYFPWPP